MRRVLTLILLTLAGGCANVAVDRHAGGDWQRVCRPGHAVRFAVPAGRPVPAAYRAPRRGSCSR
jgi:hypothetical protein